MAIADAFGPLIPQSPPPGVPLVLLLGTLALLIYIVWHFIASTRLLD